MRNPIDDRNSARPEDVLERVREQIVGRLRQLVPWLVGAVLLLALWAGMYKVGPGEQAVVRTFGKQTGRTGPGLHVRMPGIQQVDVVNVERIARLEVGARGTQRVQDESQMITGDANIVEVEMIVQYRIIDPSKYLFKLLAPEEALRATAEVALRSIVGRTGVDEVITTGREKVQAETRDWLQRLMDVYQSGIAITEVKLQDIDAPDPVRDAFHEVVRAREEKERLINEAMGYQADLIPKARGEAQKRLRDAEGYREQRVLEAKGDVAQFASVLTEYSKAPRVTRERLYIETMQRVMARSPKKTIMDESVAKNAVPVLPLSSDLGGKR